MEPIPSFSSPEKAQPNENGVHHEKTTYTVTYTADDSMDIDQSEPTPFQSVPTPTYSFVPQAQRQSQPTSSEALRMHDSAYLDPFRPART